jgi:hypothetical protein
MVILNIEVENKSHFRYKMQNILSRPSALQREKNLALLKTKFLNFLLFLWVIYSLLGSGPTDNPIRIADVSSVQ